MNFRLSNIPPARRLFLGAVVAVVLAVGWVLTEDWRTGARNHYVSSGIIIDALAGRRSYLQIETNFIMWDYVGGESGNLYNSLGKYEWEFSLSERKKLSDVTSEDARLGKYDSALRVNRPGNGGSFSPIVMIYDGQIIFARRADDPSTVYALQAVEQKDGRGHFRSRRILPDAKEGRAGSNAVPFAPANR